MTYKRISPTPIAEGGTNAATMTNANGVVYYSGSALSTTTVGSMGQVLTSNGIGVAPTFQAAPGGSGALVKIQTLTATGSTALNFTTGITNTYNNYLLIAGNVTSASNTNDSQLLVRLSVDGGATYDATNYASFPGTPLTGIIIAQAASGEDWSVAGAIGSLTTNLNNMTSGSGNVIGINNFYVVSNASVETTASIFSGIKFTTASQVINAIRVVMSDGAAFTGVFSLYGYTL